MKKLYPVFMALLLAYGIQAQPNNVGIGTNDPKSKLDVKGGITVGNTYSGVNAAPANGAIIEGAVGIGTAAPQEKVEIMSTTPVISLHSPGSASYKTGIDGGVFKIAAMENGYGGHAGSFANNDVQVLTMTTTGNIGLGTVTPSAAMHLFQDRYTLYGPNTNWGATLRVGGNGNVDNNASVATTNGNLHLDAASGGSGLYLNFYKGTGGIYLGNGAAGAAGIITAAGYLGLGTTGPPQPLSVLHNSEWNILSRSALTTASNRNHILMQRANGTGAVTANFNLGGIAMGGYDGASYSNGWNGGTEISGIASQTWTAANRGAYLSFLTTPDNTTTITERMRINSNGVVTINNLAGTGTRMVSVDASGNLAPQALPGGVLPAGAAANTLYNNGTAWVNTSNLSNDGTTINLGNFTNADAVEWPRVTWYRDGGTWDEGLIKGSSAQGMFGRSGFGIHMHQSRHFGFFSTGWDPLFDVEGGTGRTYIKGSLGLGALPSYKLDVTGDARATGNVLAGAHIVGYSSDPYFRTDGDNKHIVLSGGSGWTTTGATMVLRGASAGTNAHGMEFYAGNAERMRIVSSGKVGIGTAAPLGKLHVAGGHANGIMEDGNDRPSIGVTGTYPQMVIMAGVNNVNHGGTLMIGSYDAGTSGAHKHWSIGSAGNGSTFLDIGYHAGTDLNPHAGIRNYNGSTMMSLLNNGNIGVGQLNPTWKFQVDNLGTTPSLLVRQNGTHSYGTVGSLETFNNGNAQQDGPRLAFHKHGAKVWAVGTEPYAENGWAVWENGYNDGWGTQQFVIKPGGNMYARFMYDLDNGAFYLNPNGVSKFSQLSLSRDADNECCSGGNYTLSLAESTSGTGRTATIQFHNGGVSEGYIRLANGGTRRLEFNDNQNIGMSLNPRGHVYPIGNVTYNCGLSGSAWFDTYTDAIFRNYEFGLSDERMKTNIEPLGAATPRLMQLEPMKYDYRTDLMYGKDYKQRDYINIDGKGIYGFMAQDLMQVFPDLVKYHKEKEVYMVNYEGLIPVLTQAFKEQEQKIEDLKKLVEQQGAMIKKLAGDR